MKELQINVISCFDVCLFARGVPIIGSAIILATDMVIFNNIGISTEQQEDQYRYRYLCSSNSLYINGLRIGFYIIHVAL